MPTTPKSELDARYSMEGASATAWGEATVLLEKAELFWLSTVRPDGRLHATPLIAVWLDGAMHICTGPEEQKAKNLAQNSQCILTTGCNTLNEGLDLVVEGEAVRVTDNAQLHRIAEAYEAKYGQEWHFDVRDGGFTHDAGVALVFAVAPATAYGFAKGENGSHTRWRFEDAS